MSLLVLKSCWLPPPGIFYEGGLTAQVAHDADYADSLLFIAPSPHNTTIVAIKLFLAGLMAVFVGNLLLKRCLSSSSMRCNQRQTQHAVLQ